MTTDIYHSNYIKNRNSKKQIYSDNKDVDSENKTEETNHRGDKDEC